MLTLLSLTAASALTLGTDYAPPSRPPFSVVLSMQDIDATADVYESTDADWPAARRRYAAGALVYGVGAGGLVLGSLLVGSGLSLLNTDADSAGEALGDGIAGAIFVGFGGFTGALSLPLMSTGSLLAWRGVLRAGSALSPLWGRLSLGLSGATLGALSMAVYSDEAAWLMVAAPFALGAAATATVQVVENALAWEDRKAQAALSLAPMLAPDQLGLTACVRW